ncbi:MAG: acetyl-CoA C-acetyltransferase [Zhongshania sp.]|jgi:acetyl-CoA C-acetyltransferase
MPSDPIVIASYARTPMGGLLGDFASVKATDLGAAAVKAAVARSGVNADQIDRIYMGCVLPAGLGQAPARQAALAAGLPRSVQATTINKVCGSGMQAIIFAYETISAGNADIIIAGGMESMSNAPYLLQKHRTGARAGHDTVKDSMFLDGLEDAYEQGTSMGIFAENTVKKFGFSREEQDNYAIESLSRAKAAIASGAFEGEIVAVDVTTRSGSQTISIDEQPGKAKPEKIPTLKPAFIKDGTVTAANSSSISDGAAAVVVTRASVAARLGMTVVAQIIGSDCYAHEPGDFPSAPVPAIQKLLKKINWTVNDVDLFEVNEAFAVVPMIAMRELGIPHEKMNVNGGACALGHPLGASGARIVTTLLGALKGRGLKRGVAGICLGGGEATALAIELM